MRFKGAAPPLVRACLHHMCCTEGLCTSLHLHALHMNVKAKPASQSGAASI